MDNMILDELRAQLAQYHIEPITPETFDSVYTVYDTNQAYNIAVDGEPTTPEKSRADMTNLPPGHTLEQKLYASVWQGEQPVAIIDLIEDLPSKGIMWLSMLTVHGDCHGKGIGHGIAQGILRAASRLGYTAVRLGVMQSNQGVLPFWMKQGFSAIYEKDAIIVMEQSLEVVL